VQRHRGWLAARPLHRTCAHCDGPMAAESPQQRYCSKSFKLTAERLRTAPRRS
jgi:hypothetical protein